MSDYTVYDSDQELRENLDDINETLSDFDKTQQVLDEQRAVLGEQVQGALAEYEKRISDYEQQRDDLDRRQQELREQRQPFDEARERLQKQVDAKRDAKLGKKGTDEARQQAGGRDPGTRPAEGVNQVAGPTLREQIDQLKSQLSKPKPALNLEPPGMGNSQASAIDKDLKLMAKIKEKEEQLKQEQKETQKMDGASKKLGDNWNRSKAPKH